MMHPFMFVIRSLCSVFCILFTRTWSYIFMPMCFDLGLLSPKNYGNDCRDARLSLLTNAPSWFRRIQSPFLNGRILEVSTWCVSVRESFMRSVVFVIRTRSSLHRYISSSLFPVCLKKTSLVFKLFIFILWNRFLIVTDDHCSYSMLVSWISWRRSSLYFWDCDSR